MTEGQSHRHGAAARQSASCCTGMQGSLGVPSVLLPVQAGRIGQGSIRRRAARVQDSLRGCGAAAAHAVTGVTAQKAANPFAVCRSDSLCAFCTRLTASYSLPQPAAKTTLVRARVLPANLLVLCLPLAQSVLCLRFSCRRGLGQSRPCPAAPAARASNSTRVGLLPPCPGAAGGCTSMSSTKQRALTIHDLPGECLVHCLALLPQAER